jgi:hypothetical protein
LIFIGALPPARAGVSEAYHARAVVQDSTVALDYGRRTLLIGGCIIELKSAVRAEAQN